MWSLCNGCDVVVLGGCAASKQKTGLLKRGVVAEIELTKQGEALELDPMTRWTHFNMQE